MREREKRDKREFEKKNSGLLSREKIKKGLKA